MKVSLWRVAQLIPLRYRDSTADGTGSRLWSWRSRYRFQTTGSYGRSLAIYSQLHTAGCGVGMRMPAGDDGSWDGSGVQIRRLHDARPPSSRRFAALRSKQDFSI